MVLKTRTKNDRFIHKFTQSALHFWNDKIRLGFGLGRHELKSVPTNAHASTEFLKWSSWNPSASMNSLHPRFGAAFWKMWLSTILEDDWLGRITSLRFKFYPNRIWCIWATFTQFKFDDCAYLKLKSTFSGALPKSVNVLKNVIMLSRCISSVNSGFEKGDLSFYQHYSLSLH